MVLRKDKTVVTVAMTDEQIQTITSRLDEWKRSKTARVVADLEAYWALLRLGLERVRKLLTGDEARLVLESLDDGAFQAQSSLWMRGGLVIAVEDRLSVLDSDAGWPDTVAKLKSLGVGEVAALIDWCRQMASLDAAAVDKELALFQGAEHP